jgi:hypothetical protein
MDTLISVFRHLARIEWDLAAFGILWLVFLAVVGWGVAQKREGN